MLKAFWRVSGNEDTKYDNLKLKKYLNRVVSKFGRIVEWNILNNILKVPVDGR